MADNTLPTNSGRRLLRTTGALLWLLVGAALVGVWFSRRHQALPPEPDSEPKVVRIETDAEGVINVDELLDKSSTSKTPAGMWDPQGVEDFSFANCDGRTIGKQDLLGKPWVAAFVFTHCLGPCPVITRRMRDLQDRFKEEPLQLVTFTVDPDRDTPEALKVYAEVNGADLNRWYFLTGEARAIYGLIHRSFRMPVQDPRQEPEDSGKNYQIIHSRNLMLVDQRGVVRGKFDGTKDEDMAALAREIRHLIHPPSPRTVTPTLPSSQEIPPHAWYMKLPAVNAGLNGLATVLLAAGFVLIKRGRRLAHQRLMLAAFAVSIAFLTCYLVYHAALHSETGLAGKKFEGVGAIRGVYFTILISHVLLAAAVPVLAMLSIYRGWKCDWTKHRRIAKITWPIWMYVSVTGVIIYGMLYHWPPGAG